MAWQESKWGPHSSFWCINIVETEVRRNEETAPAGWALLTRLVAVYISMSGTQTGASDLRHNREAVQRFYGRNLPGRTAWEVRSSFVAMLLAQDMTAGVVITATAAVGLFAAGRLTNKRRRRDRVTRFHNHEAGYPIH